MKNIIYYFTGTGNSLHTAKVIAAALADCAVVSVSAKHIPLPDEGTERIGFVYPVYAGGLPLMMRRFISSLDLPKQAYLFGVATHGGHLLGGVRDLGELISQRGGMLHYGGDVKLPGNFILLYGRMENTDALLQSGEAALHAAAADILAKAEKPAKRPSQTIRRIHDQFMANVPCTALDFSVTDACTRCGLCAALCPAGNISLEAGVPRFAEHCESCMACVQGCPNRAIEHKNGIAARERYRHPAVTLQELTERNKQAPVI